MFMCRGRQSSKPVITAPESASVAAAAPLPDALPACQQSDHTFELISAYPAFLLIK